MADAAAIAGGIPGTQLMEVAGRAVAAAVAVHHRRRPVAVVCGPGNNGGDGYAVGRHVANEGIEVQLVRAAGPAETCPDAVANYRICRKMGLSILDAEEPSGLESAIAAIGRATAIVDGLLGSGSRGAPRGTMTALMEAANRASSVRIAIDIPTGLQADSGEVFEPCFRAGTTVTLLAPKLGFSNPVAQSVLGRVVIAGIGIAPRFISST